MELCDPTQLLLVFSQLLIGRIPTASPLIQSTLHFHKQAIRIGAHLLDFLILLNQISWEYIIVFQSIIHVVRIEYTMPEFRKMHLKVSLL